MNNELDSLDKVKQAFSEWRELRPKQSPIPDYLWDMVQPLLDEYPRAMITRVLGISSSQIKNRFLGNKVTFVEAISNNLEAQPTDTQGEDVQQRSCDIELRHHCGSVLKINALPISILSNLIPSFIGQ